MKISHGIDICSVSRLKQAADNHGVSFLKRIFKPAERRYCDARRMKYEHYAARFAAKEALIKAVKPQKALNIELRDIEIRKYASGKPYIHLSTPVRKKLNLHPEAQIELSLTHERTLAMASVVIVHPET